MGKRKPQQNHRVKPVFVHTFSGRKYQVHTDEFVGWCDTSEKRDRFLMMFPSGISRTREGLDTVVHEAIHACLPRLPERDVVEMANDISSFLWKLGYRK